MSKRIKVVDGQLIEYEILKLRDQYDPELHKVTQPVNFETMPGQDISYHAMSLMETCNQLGGLGLSSNQCVGGTLRMCAVNMIGDDKIWILINPTIIESSETLSEFKEGCLSFPGLYLKVKRPDWVFVEFYAIGGEKLHQKFDGLTATIVQHELDHLRGITYTELVPKVTLAHEKGKVKANMRKMKKWMAQQQVNA